MNYRRNIPETAFRTRRHGLGRHVNHDPRSLAYRVQATGTQVAARWERVTPILDQGDLGSCTGNAAVGVLGTHPFVETFARSSVLDEAEAVRLYSAATKLDDAPGAYPPLDSGSDGLSVAKACKAAGYISGYQHITSLAAAYTAIQAGPFIVGTNFYEGMENPDAAGYVKPTGQLLGGHEYECLGYEPTSGLWEFVNSWGTSWGKGGHFFYSSATLARLLAEDGDATTFVPTTQPPPTPIPVPIDADQVLADATRDWSAAKHTGSNKTAAAAVAAWRKAKNL